MSPKTIAIGSLLLLTASLATSAEASEPKAATGKRVVAVAAPAQAPAPAPALAPAPAPTEEQRAPSAAPRPERAESEAAPDEGPAPDGFSIGARVGYALPMGSMAKDASLNGATDLSRTVAGMVPFWADLGYRLSPRWYVGGYFQLGILGTSGDLCKRAAANGDCSSSGTDFRFGAVVRYTFKPGANLSPWVGISSGYEITNISVSAGTTTGDASIKGWEFVGFHLGADLHPAPAVSVGPMLMVSLGQYGTVSDSDSSSSKDYNNPALHEWVFFGVHGQYDL